MALVIRCILRKCRWNNHHALGPLSPGARLGLPSIALVGGVHLQGLQVAQRAVDDEGNGLCRALWLKVGELRLLVMRNSVRTNMTDDVIGPQSWYASCVCK
eukprot:CAMPEP_0117622748 /NCGR_PEP_ID=MMETSP0784-20121206/88300_1 /TAXON_ID=39447 /ORGANISM="" /LENGTH=100 /DNA_ID=CAMNT_0005426695 /DNA_START=63 /DNA_END=364 /DNA_ORIENTATION=+